MPALFQPPAFPRETPESIKKYIEETYLQPGLDADEFSPEKVGRQWEFDWFDRAKVPLEPSLPRTVVVPIWEPPFRRPRKGTWNQSLLPFETTIFFCFVFEYLFFCLCFCPGPNC